MKKMMKTSKKASGGMADASMMKDGGMSMKKGGKCYAAGGAAKVRLKEATQSGAPMKPKGKK